MAMGWGWHIPQARWEGTVPQVRSDLTRVLGWEKDMRFWGKGNSKRNDCVERMCSVFFNVNQKPVCLEQS